MRRNLQDSGLNVKGGPVPHNVVLNQNGFMIPIKRTIKLEKI